MRSRVRSRVRLKVRPGANQEKEKEKSKFKQWYVTRHATSRAQICNTLAPGSSSNCESIAVRYDSKNQDHLQSLVMSRIDNFGSQRIRLTNHTWRDSTNSLHHNAFRFFPFTDRLHPSFDRNLIKSYKSPNHATALVPRWRVSQTELVERPQ